jgi:glutamyl-tRNA synthetase
MRAMSSPVVTRFAPSPTGELHLGNARTALFNWLLARRSGGRFLLRIEDTDARRSDSALAVALQRDLRWLGLDWDEGPDVGGPSAPYVQSARGALYSDALSRLEAAGAVYPCYCTPLEIEVSRRAALAAGRPPRYAGTCRELSAAERGEREAEGRVPSLRFRVPAGGEVAFDDLVHGSQRFACADIGDFVVRRADGSAAFFFGNVLDDALMGVSVVLRGEDHLSNTPRQLLLAKALELAAPAYGHLPLIVDAAGAPLSKRAGAASLRQLRAQGVLPAAITNHLFRLGHSSAAQGWLSLPEMAAAFDTAHIGRAPARLDETRLAGWQREAVHRLAPDAALDWMRAELPQGLPPGPARAFASAVQPNVETPAEAGSWARIVFGTELPEPDEQGRAVVATAGPDFFAAAVAAVDAHGDDWRAVCAAVRETTGRRGPELFRPLRWALTGVGHGPELAPLLPLITPARARARLQRFARNEER